MRSCHSDSFEPCCINRNILECKVVPALTSIIVNQRINRNILECKDIYCQQSYFSRKRINRNILECKDISQDREIIVKTVLIETYWNVKSKPAAELVSEPIKY